MSPYTLCSPCPVDLLKCGGGRKRIVLDGVEIGQHDRCFDRGETIYNPWHYVSVLTRKPIVLRNGAPFHDRVMPAAMEKVRHRLKAMHDGDRQMVSCLECVDLDGLPAVEGRIVRRRHHR
ncbi:hypothetical protein [Mycoplana rhizolycopersici]|uniref:Uncharacterized protein n=1 Tax=Mycoplana rhizolycopersici TaxID=2746702 RepID=A0ABX2QIL8_9HYPH|nr:hypothetical protein [Rhizobium rhizolycopersici]